MATLTNKTKNTISSQVSYLLTEAGDYILQESGDKIIVRLGQWSNKNKSTAVLTPKDKN